MLISQVLMAAVMRGAQRLCDECVSGPRQSAGKGRFEVFEVHYRSPNRFVLPQKLWTRKIHLGPYPYNTNRRARGRQPSHLTISSRQERGLSLTCGMLTRAIVSRTLGASGVTLFYFQLIKLALTRKVLRAYLRSSKKKIRPLDQGPRHAKL